VRQTALDAYAHQDLTFEHLVDALGLERHLSHSPLFQVMLGVQNAPMDAPALPGLTFEPLELAAETAKFDLTFFFTEADDLLSGVIEYSTDLFDAPTI